MSVMKRFFSLFICAFAALSLSAQGHSVELGKLPAASQQFLKSHFEGQKIDNISHKQHSSCDCYVVHFADGNKVAFDASTGECVMLDMKSGTIPASMLPTGVSSYLATHNAKDGVKSVARTKCGWRVGLVSGKALCFDVNGNYQKECDGSGCKEQAQGKKCGYHGEPKAMRN